VASAINPSLHPTGVNNRAEDLRFNLQTAKTEIEALQSGKEDAGTATSAVATHVAAPDPHGQYALETDVATALAAKQDAATVGNVNARVAVENNGTLVGARRAINFIPGTNVTLSITDDSVNEEVDVTINASGGGGIDHYTTHIIQGVV
jgi:hypothetical protein